MKKFVLAIVYTIFTACSFAQNVFTYGKKAVTKEEFVRALNKNPDTGTDRKKALKEYLNLYINFKLKVQAAYDAGLAKDASLQTELQNFKTQLADNIINEEANVKLLVKEAFERSQKEIRLQQVFVQTAENGDTLGAYNAIQAAFKQLKDGKDFSAVAEEFASDTETKKSKGELGYITVFTLPYDLENHVYKLEPNSFSAPVKSKAGYHIFKNAGERRSSGSRRVAQILVAIPPNATIEDKKAASARADSIFKILKSGTSFSEVAAVASNDLTSSNNGGELPEFTVGTYNTEFENVAFSLKNKGDISLPFASEYGFHILQLLEAKQISGDITDPMNFSALQDKVMKDQRLEWARKKLIQKKLAVLKFNSAVIKASDLYAFTEHALGQSKVGVVKGISDQTPIFSFSKQSIKAGDWVKFLANSKNSLSQLNRRYLEELYKQFIHTTADTYYRNNLATFNNDFVKQLKEFEEANLLFAIMEKKVWGKANTDSIGLLQYYNQHKLKYTWAPSADVISVTCNNEKDAREIQQELKSHFSKWREFAGSSERGIIVDSSRYELVQLPGQDKAVFAPGVITAFDKNQNEGTYTFNYIVKVYPEPGQRSFDDARGLVINDYQQLLEEKWIRELKKKYPVKVNEAIVQSIR